MDHPELLKAEQSSHWLVQEVFSVNKGSMVAIQRNDDGTNCITINGMKQFEHGKNGKYWTSIEKAKDGE